MNKQIDCTVGIYDTEYTLTEHRNGTITVKAPQIKWTGNSGSLDFTRIKITKPSVIAEVKRFFREEILADDTGVTLDYLLY